MTTADCTGCAYWRKVSLGTMCHYALDRHICRLVPAQDCPYHTEKGGTMAKKIDDAVAMELYEQGLSDREIGDRFGATGKAVQLWRKSKGLPSHNPPRTRTPKADKPPVPDELPTLDTPPMQETPQPEPDYTEMYTRDALPQLAHIARQIRDVGIPYERALDVLALLLPAIELLEDVT